MIRSFWQLLTLAVLAAPTLYLAWAWPVLPAQIPSHFGSGGIDGYTSRADAWLLTTALPLGVYLLMFFLPRFDPRQRLVADSRSLHKLTLLLVGAVSALACYSLYLALHPGMQPGRGMNVGIALFFTFLGNYLTTVQPNYFLGIRTPWALENDEVWAKTHRVVGRMFFGWGLIATLVAVVEPISWFEPLLLAMVLIAILLAYGYSYWAYRQVLRAAS